MAKKSAFKGYGDEFVKRQIRQLRKYIEASPIDKLDDRYEEFESGSVRVIASIEAQRKDLVESLGVLIELVTILKDKEEDVGKDTKFIEQQIKRIERYIDANPFQGMKDRKCQGTLVATREKQRKDMTDTIKELIQIKGRVEAIVEHSADKDFRVQGDAELSLIARRFLNK